MITIQINKNDKKEIISFSLNGHAGYKEAGSDIVCSAVSAVTNMVLIGLNEKLCISLSCEKEKSGSLSCKLPNGLNEVDNGKAQFLLTCMVEEFKDIETNYGEYIKIVENGE